LSKRWEERHRVVTAPPVRVAPVHAGAAQQKEEEKKESQKIPEKKEETKIDSKVEVKPEVKPETKTDSKEHAKPKNSKLSKMFQPVDTKSDGALMSTARKEVDQQNIVQAKELEQKPEEKVETKSVTKPLQKKKNPFQVNLDKVDKSLTDKLIEFEQNILSNKSSKNDYGVFYSYIYQGTVGRKARVERARVFMENIF
jgi:hypothetical protein